MSPSLCSKNVAIHDFHKYLLESGLTLMEGTRLLSYFIANLTRVKAHSPAKIFLLFCNIILVILQSNFPLNLMTDVFFVKYKIKLQNYKIIVQIFNSQLS